MQLKTPPTLEPKAAEPLTESATAEPHRARRAWWLWLGVLAVVVVAGYWLFQQLTKSAVPAAMAARPAARAVPVVTAAARVGDMPVYLSGLGSVTAFNTVTVKSRIDGQLVKVAFLEGQFVHAGDLLAEIDPRPFQVQLTQAEGQMARDAAQLKDAEINLERYRYLVDKGYIPRQQFDDQAALVHQYHGSVKLDQGVIDNAKLQLTFCHITAPISGRVGLRLVDVGNMVHASDQNGLVVITQVEPIAVLFTLPQDNLPSVLSKLHGGAPLPVEAYGRTGQRKLADGKLLTIDNQIDPSTGTIRLKALFENRDKALFPNQFVNVRLLLDVKAEAVIVPAAAIQRGPQGTFVYVVKADHTVEARPVTVGPSTGADAAIDSGLSAEEQVVVEGVDKLRPGSTVQIRAPEAAEAPARKPTT